MVRSELVRPATGTAARQAAREGDRSANRDHQRIFTDAELDFRTARVVIVDGPRLARLVTARIGVPGGGQ